MSHRGKITVISSPGEKSHPPTPDLADLPRSTVGSFIVFGRKLEVARKCLTDKVKKEMDREEVSLCGQAKAG